MVQEVVERCEGVVMHRTTEFLQDYQVIIDNLLDRDLNLRQRRGIDHNGMKSLPLLLLVI